MINYSMQKYIFRVKLSKNASAGEVSLATHPSVRSQFSQDITVRNL